MEYYVYISDQKVDMLASQISEKMMKTLLKRLEISIKLPWIPFAASYKPGDPMPSDQERVRRLRVVEEAIDLASIGVLDGSREWIKSTLEMRWGFIDDERKAVWFLGAAKNVTIVMGGSAKHLIGGVDVANQPHHAYSLLPVLSEALIAHTESDSETDELDEATAVFNAARSLATSASGPMQRLSFLAKTLAVEKKDGETVVLATPLYVASAHE